ncbi:hypothetical protein [Microtetraspora malaysiensis]|uniref:Uncharacterized protein n=1 Tax=Microtetraspora malaysiensis TaxID=161358 RepID=A0ABW6T207_9ACTN
MARRPVRQHTTPQVALVSLVALINAYNRLGVIVRTPGGFLRARRVMSPGTPWATALRCGGWLL